MRKMILIMLGASVLCGRGNVYLQEAKVYEVKEEEVIVEVSDGNLYGFYGSEWELGDKCVLIMDDMGTEDITDDEIIMEVKVK